MDFDEYEYLEKTVENPEVTKQKQRANSGGRNLKSEERRHNGSSKHKDDGYVDLYDKRSKSGEDSRDYEKHRERGSSRHAAKSRDGVKEKDKPRSSGGNRDRDRDHEDNDRKRDRDRVHEEKDRKRDRDHDQEQARDRRDRGSENERERPSSSRSQRHPSDLGDREREASRHMNYRDRERNREKDYRDGDRVRESREKDKEIRRHKEKKEETTEPEADPERDQRTVFAYQISLKADERDVYEFFSRAGKVRDVRLIMDRNSRRSKGVGYIEFYDVMSVPMAIALSGQPLLGQPVMVKPSEAEKNLVQSTTSIASGSTGYIGPYSGGGKLYVGNLHVSITEADLRRVFEAFGQVELVQLPTDEIGHCKGFGFVQFARLEDAKNAQSLNGQLEIGGRTIKVSSFTDKSGMQEVGGNTGDFDDDEGGGLSLNACSRAILMQKLDHSGTALSMAGSLGNFVVNNTGLNIPATGNICSTVSVGSLVSPHSSVPAIVGLAGGGLQMPTDTIPSIDTIGVPSECLLLKNMFDPKDETEPDFDLDIKEDVEAECSKFGTIKHIYVDKKSAGFVYLRFEDTQSAIGAQRALHGRWFAGKMITSSFMVPQSYEDKFPDSR